MKFYFLMVLFAVPLISCNQKKIEITHVQTATPIDNLKNVKVVNVDDPVCKMPMKDHLKFTSNYKGKTYGFCSLSCKTQFIKNPEKYLQ